MDEKSKKNDYELILDAVLTFKTRIILSLEYLLFHKPRIQAAITTLIKFIFDQSKLFLWTMLGLTPFGIRRQPWEVQPHHILHVNMQGAWHEFLYWELGSIRFLENKSEHLIVVCHSICIFSVQVKEPARLETRKGSLGKSEALLKEKRSLMSWNPISAAQAKIRVWKIHVRLKICKGGLRKS